MKFDVQSKDVIHDFWVPDFRMKIDAVPGHHDALPRHAEARGVGDHPIVCAELCGLGPRLHAPDRARPRPGRLRRLGAEDDRPARRGRRRRRRRRRGAPSDAKALFTDGDADTGATACGPATRWPTRAPTGQVGPDLDKVLKGKDAAFIKQSIVDPDKVIAHGLPGRASCPRTSAIRCQAEQVDALVKYLSDGDEQVRTRR